MGTNNNVAGPIRWLFNAIINAMTNAIFTGGVSHGVICIKEPQIRIPKNQNSYEYAKIRKITF